MAALAERYYLTNMQRTDTSTLIAVEGIDGAGKTTQVRLLAQFFEAAGVPFRQSKEPTEGYWGRKIRRSATGGRLSPSDELHAFIEDRKEHTEKLIQPALSRGEVVILDRYFYSTVAYQGRHPGFEPDVLMAQMFELALKPDIVLLIDVPVAVGQERITEGRREAPNEFEDASQQKQIRAIFQSLAKRHADHIVTFDGTRDAEFVRREIVQTLLDGVLKKQFCAKAYGCDNFYCVPRMTGTCKWANMYAHAGLSRTTQVAAIG